MIEQYINDIDLNLLNHLFTFDMKNGKVFWKNPPKLHPRMLGKEAGAKRLSGKNKYYCRIKINKKAVLRSHIIFYVANGFKAKPCIDHINGNSLDDRPCNLRQATITENAWNHKFRKKSNNLPMGIRFQSNKFIARISHNKHQIHIGSFNKLDDAVNAYKQKRIELYGQYSGY